MLTYTYFKKSFNIPKYITIRIVGGCISIYSKLVYYNYIWIFGNYGYTKKRIPSTLSLKQKFNWLFIQSAYKSIILSTISNIKNIVFGLSKGFSFSIKIIGVGYKIKPIFKKTWIIFKLGFSHYLRLKLNTKEFRIFLLKKKVLTVLGHDKQALKTMYCRIKSFRRLDPYKIKGIFFLNDGFKIKPGKKEQI